MFHRIVKPDYTC